MSVRNNFSLKIIVPDKTIKIEDKNVTGCNFEISIF
jgi:hypothetical protein